MLNDLDNNLIADEFSSFDSTSSRTAAGFTVIGQPLTPIVNPTVNPRGSTIVEQPKPRTGTTITEPTIQPSPRTPQALTETEAPTIPRTNPYTTGQVTEAPIEEPVIDTPIPTMFGGGGGGGSVQRTSEEEMPMEAPVAVEKRIIGLKPKMFYSLLGLAAIGGYVYFKYKSK